MSHRLVKMMFSERLSIVHGKGWNKGDDHFADMGIAVCLELHDLF